MSHPTGLHTETLSDAPAASHTQARRTRSCGGPLRCTSRWTACQMGRPMTCRTGRRAYMRRPSDTLTLRPVTFDDDALIGGCHGALRLRSMVTSRRIVAVVVLCLQPMTYDDGRSNGGCHGLAPTIYDGTRRVMAAVALRLCSMVYDDPSNGCCNGLAHRIYDDGSLNGGASLSYAYDLRPMTMIHQMAAVVVLRLRSTIYSAGPSNGDRRGLAQRFTTQACTSVSSVVRSSRGDLLLYTFSLLERRASQGLSQGVDKQSRRTRYATNAKK